MKRKRFLSMCMSIIMVLSVILSTEFIFAQKKAFADTSIKFTDVKKSDWFYKDIMELTKRGFILGYPDKTFKPNAQIRVDEFIKALVSSIDENVEPSEGDYWADNYIQKAKELGIVKDGEFQDYTRYITRGEMARMIVRAAELNGENQYDKLENFKYIIPDYNDIKADLQEYVIKAYSRGLITGYGDKSFRADDFATRAQACVMIIRLSDESGRPEVDSTVVPRYKVVGNEENSNGYKDWIAIKQDTSIPFDIINQHIWQFNDPECISHPINSYKQTLPNLYSSGYSTSTYKYDPNEYFFMSYANASTQELMGKAYYGKCNVGGTISYYYFDKTNKISYLEPVTLKEGQEIRYKMTLRKVKPDVLSKEQAEKMTRGEIEKFVNTLNKDDFDYYTIYLKGKLPKFEPENKAQKLENLQYE